MNYPDEFIKEMNLTNITKDELEENIKKDLVGIEAWKKHHEKNMPKKRKRGRPRKLPNDQLTPKQRADRKRIKNSKNIYLSNKIKEDFEKCQRAESEVLGFELTSQQTIRLLLNIYFREQHIER